MNLNSVKTFNTQKCFKCEKKDYIQRFCKEKKKAVKISSLEEDSENNRLLTTEKSQKEEL